MPVRPLLALGLAAALAACHKPPSSPGGVGADDAAALNNAADMLDTSPDDLTAPANGADNADDDDANAGGNGA